MIITYRYRVKSKNGLLNQQARAVNYVWNYMNEAQKHTAKAGRRWLSNYDLHKMTAGTSKELGIHSVTINAIADKYVSSRRKTNRPWLRFRGSKSLGWVPFKAQCIAHQGDTFRYNGAAFRVFYTRHIPPGTIRDGGSFSQDARGDWYINISVEVTQEPIKDGRAVGIDLGLKDLAVLSTGERIENPRHTQHFAASLAAAQRARKSDRVRAIHAKIANVRQDAHHKLSARLVDEFAVIAVGDVSSSALGATRMAKSVFDAGWYSLKEMLAYKSKLHGVLYEEVNERFSTQTCSECGSLGGPKGLQGLVIRAWDCPACGRSHDRDTNAAVNLLLRHGHVSPVQGAGVAGPEMPNRGTVS